MAGGGRVDDDQVGRPGAFELLDLAQHQHVSNPGDGGGDDIDDPGGDEPARHPMEPVVTQVLEQRVVGGDPTSAHRAPAVVEECRVLVVERAALAERGGHRGLSLQLDQEDGQSVAGRQEGQRRRSRRLADATLAGDHQHLALGAERGDVHPSASVVLGTPDPAHESGEVLVRPLVGRTGAELPFALRGRGLGVEYASGS